MSGYDVDGLKRSAVIPLQRDRLGHYRATQSLELIGYPGTAMVMGFAVHDSRTEIALCLTEGISRIGIESDRDRYSLSFVGAAGLIAALARNEEKNGSKETKASYSVYEA